MKTFKFIVGTGCIIFIFWGMGWLEPTLTWLLSINIDELTIWHLLAITFSFTTVTYPMKLRWQAKAKGDEEVDIGDKILGLFVMFFSAAFAGLFWIFALTPQG